MVYRIFVEKKPGLDNEARGLLSEAIKEAYRLADGVQFENAYRRSDIGQRALKACPQEDINGLSYFC